MVQKTVNTEAKKSLRSSTIIWHLDICCPRGHHLSYNTSSKVQIQNLKNFFCHKKPKPKDPKLGPSRDNVVELPKKEDKKDKKKRFWNQKRKYMRKQKKQTLATNVNVTEAASKKK